MKSISYLQKCFTYAANQNHGDPEGLKAHLKSVVPHTFDEHEQCQYLSAPEGYKHKSQQHGKGLTEVQLRTDLDNIFSSYVMNVDKLSKLESSQANERFNNTVASKAPKNKHYSGSESLSQEYLLLFAKRTMVMLTWQQWVTDIKHDEIECVVRHDLITCMSPTSEVTAWPMLLCTHITLSE